MIDKSNPPLQPMTEAEAVANVARAGAHGPQVMRVTHPETNEQIVLSVVPDNMTARDVTAELDKRLPAPRRRTGTIVVKAMAAFIAMTNRHKSEATVVYCDDGQKPTFTAVMNDHRPDADGTPGYRDHRVLYAPELSPEWQAWTGRDSKLQDSSSFAEFLEERALDLVDPAAQIPASTQKVIDALGVSVAAPATVRGLARDITIHVRSTVKEARNLQSGEAQIVFDTQHTDSSGNKLTIPGAFLVAIPIYRGELPFLFVARLRYRVKDGQVLWAFQLAQTDLAKREVMAEMITTIREETECLTIEGTP